MAVYLVTWNINKAGAAYDKARATLIARLSTYQHVYDPDLDTVWFLSSGQSVDQIYARLKPALDDNDRLIVTRLRPTENEGWLSIPVVQWLDARL